MTKLYAFNIQKFAAEDDMVLTDFRNYLCDTQSDTLVSSRVLCHAVVVAYLGLARKQDGGYTD